jgi:peptide/nickel transport system substrate-binding protein
VKRNNPKAIVLTIPPQTTGILYLQLGDPTSVFLDERVRQALSMALDRTAIASAVFGNQYSDMLFVPTQLGRWSLRVSQLDTDTGKYYKYNPTEAKRLLQEAGILTQTFKWAFTASTDASRNPEQETMLNMVTAVGLKTASVQIDFVKDYVDAGKGYRQGYFPKDTIVFGHQQPFTEVDEFLYGYFDSKATQNQEHLNDPTLDAMIEKARTLVNEEDRLKASLDVQRYLAKKVYVITAGGGNTFTMVQPRVQNYSFSTTQSACAESYAKLWLNK